jgi:hypothetical protein
MAHDAEYLSLLNGKGDVFQGRDIVRCAGLSGETPQQRFPKGQGAIAVDAVAFGQAVYFNGEGHEEA